MIPNQLKKDGIQFCKVMSKSKRPYEKDWVNKGYSYEEIDTSTGNYGVLGGFGDLIIIDSDTQELQEAVENKLPKTFRVRTGSGGCHDYYFCKGLSKKLVLTKDGKHYGEVQSFGTQVVGPGSTHPNGNKYEIEQDLEIVEIKLPDLIEFVKPFTDEFNKKIEWESPTTNYNSEYDINSINIKDVLSGSFKPQGNGEFLGPNPWHGSSTGINFCVNPSKNVAHCFRCNCGVNVAQAIGLNEGIISNCSDKLTRDQFIEVLKVAQNKYGLKKPDIKVIENFADELIKEFTNKRDLIKKFLKIHPIFYDRTKNFWMWNHEEFKWFLVDETDILNSLSKKIVLNTLNSREKSELLEGLRQVGRENIPKPIPKSWVQFKNNLVDIKTGEIIEATPEYFATNPIPWDISGSSETPTMDRIFEEWVGKEYVQTLYEIISYCLIPDYPIHRIFCFVGAGMNGKSKYLELITKFVGKENTTSTELDTLLASRFEITSLHKKLVCQMGETNFNEMKKTSTLKKLSGGDLISFEYKGKDHFQDYNYSKILISTNNLPTTTDKTIGFYRRWMIIDFPNQFSEKKEILNDIPEEEYKALARKSIIILKDLLEKRKFTNEGTIEERTKRFEDRSNPLGKFLDEETEDDLNGHIIKSDFIKRLNEWCDENNFRKLTEHVIGKVMKERGFTTEQIQTDWYDSEGKKQRVRVWVGLKFKSEGV